MSANYRSKGPLPERATYHSGRASDHRIGGAEDLDPEERERRKRLYGFGKYAAKTGKRRSPLSYRERCEPRKARDAAERAEMRRRIEASLSGQKPYAQILDEAIARAKGGGK